MCAPLHRSRRAPTTALAAVGLALALVGGCSSGTTAGSSTTSAATAASARGDGGDSSGGVPAVVPADVAVVASPVDESVLVAQLEVAVSPAASVAIEATAEDHRVVTPPTAATSERHSIALVGLRAARTYTIEVRAFDDGGTQTGSAITTYTTDALPEFIPPFEHTADPSRTSPGVTLIEVIPESDPGFVMAVDEDGEVVWYYRDDVSIGSIATTPDGTFLGIRYPFVFEEFDVAGIPLRRWQFASDLSATAPASSAPPTTRAPSVPIDTVELDAPWIDLRNPHHEVAVLPNGNLLGLAMTSHDVTDDFRRRQCPNDDAAWRVTSDVAVEFDRDGTVLRTWDVWDAIDIVEHPGVHLCVTEGLFATELDRDWSHSNAVVYDADRDVVLVSVRHTDMIVAFDHDDTTGPQADVRWILGEHGTLALDGEPPYHQHAPEVGDDGSLLVYDNGNFRPGTGEDDAARPLFSRAVLYEIADTGADPTAWTATQVWEHRVADEDGTPVYAEFLGDADRLPNGNVLIDHGGIRGEDGDVRTLIIEVSPDGETVMELRIDQPDESFSSYRAERIESFSTGPSWSPV